MAPEETEKQVHYLLGRLVHAFARLDLCVGLQLKWLGPYRGVEVGKLLNPRQPLDASARGILSSPLCRGISIPRR